MYRSIVWFILFLGFSIQALAGGYLIICGKLIRVDGDTNVGSFSCEYAINESYDTLFFSSKSVDQEAMAFSLEVPEFKCGNFILNKDFQETLCVDKYPQITIKVLDLNQSGNCSFMGNIELHLVGKKKIIRNLHFEEEGQQKTSSKLTTFFSIKASEFGLSLPNRFGGLITTDDCIEISVDLKLL